MNPQIFRSALLVISPCLFPFESLFKGQVTQEQETLFTVLDTIFWILINFSQVSRGFNKSKHLRVEVGKVKRDNLQSWDSEAGVNIIGSLK